MNLPAAEETRAMPDQGGAADGEPDSGAEPSTSETTTSPVETATPSGAATPSEAASPVDGAGGPGDDAGRSGSAAARESAALEIARRLAPGFAARAAQYDVTGAFPTEDFAELRASGLLGLLVPEAHGGMGASFAEYVDVAAELAAGAGATALIFNMHASVTGALAHTPEELLRQLGAGPEVFAARERLLRGAADGALYAVAMSERGAGSRLSRIRTTYRATEDGYHLTGSKSFVSGAGYADGYLVAAREADAAEERGTADGTGEGAAQVSYFLVPGSPQPVDSGSPSEEVGNGPRVRAPADGTRADGTPGSATETPEGAPLGASQAPTPPATTPPATTPPAATPAPRSALGGVRVEPTWDAMGMRATGSHDLHLDVTVPKEALLGGVAGLAVPLAQVMPQWLVASYAAVYVGVARAAVTAAAAHLEERGLSGLPSVRSRVGRADAAVAAATLVVREAARRVRDDPGAAETNRWVWRAKLVAGDTAAEVAASALEAAGSSAMRRGHPLERIYRDARCGALQPATSDVCADWLGIVALGGDPDADAQVPRW